MAGFLTMNKQTTINRIYEYVEMIQGKQDEYFRCNKFIHSPSNEVDVNLGRRYAKVILKDREWGPQNTPMTLNKHKSVHTFIDMANGNIHKAAGWNAPAPNGVRGNIFSFDCGASVVNEHGANYKYNYA
jgi:hypothetical protein